MPSLAPHGEERALNEVIVAPHLLHFRYGISFDIEGFDPMDSPGVGTPVENGIRLKDWLAFLPKTIAEIDSRFVGLEVVEYNPYLDVDYKTRNALIAVIKSIFTSLPSRSMPVV